MSEEKNELLLRCERESTKCASDFSSLDFCFLFGFFYVFFFSFVSHERVKYTHGIYSFHVQIIHNFYFFFVEQLLNEILLALCKWDDENDIRSTYWNQRLSHWNGIWYLYSLLKNSVSKLKWIKNFGLEINEWTHFWWCKDLFIWV